MKKEKAEDSRSQSLEMFTRRVASTAAGLDLVEGDIVTDEVHEPSCLLC